MALIKPALDNQTSLIISNRSLLIQNEHRSVLNQPNLDDSSLCGHLYAQPEHIAPALCLARCYAMASSRAVCYEIRSSELSSLELHMDCSESAREGGGNQQAHRLEAGLPSSTKRFNISYRSNPNRRGSL